MSFVVLGIAAAHAIPPIVGAVVGNSKTSVAVGAIIGGAIAVASGSLVYIAADLVGLAVGIWLGLSIVGSN